MLRNRNEVADRLHRLYPPELKKAGVGGTAMIWIRIDENGEVRETNIRDSTGHPDLDFAALRLGYMMRWEPATNRGRPVAVWVAVPVTFSVL